MSPKEETGKQEKLIFKFSFANKNLNEQSPTRAISVSASSSCECKSKHSDKTNEGVDQMATPVKFADHEATYTD